MTKQKFLTGLLALTLPLGSVGCDDWLAVDIGAADGGLAAWAAWVSELPMALRDYVPTGPPLEDEDTSPRRWVKRIALPSAARRLFGPNVALRLTVRDRDGHAADALAGPPR